MDSNVYTKNEILQKLSSKGYFIDVYTLDTFLKKWKIETIFEDEQGSEFYDKNVVELILKNLFNDNGEENKTDLEEETSVRTLSSKPKTEEKIPQPNAQTQNIAPQIQAQNIAPQIQYQMPPQPQMQQMYYQQQAPMPQINPQTMLQNLAANFYNAQTPPKPQIDPQINSFLNDISLSDGTPLIKKVSNVILPDIPAQIDDVDIDIDIDSSNKPTKQAPKKKMGILEGAMDSVGEDIKAGLDFTSDTNANTSNEQSFNANEDGDFDDMGLLSESLQAQEKFKEYVISELAKKNSDIMSQINAPANNEFKIDISEKTIGMIARTMAKKIVKHVSTMLSSQLGNSEKLAQIEEQNKTLEKRAKELEEQNKKLRILLAETNKNLNSYKPSIFGLYKKVTPQNTQNQQPKK